MRSQATALLLCAALTWGQQPPADDATKATPDPIEGLVGRLNLENYKATIKSLTQFGDRRQGTDRNRAAIDWIEAQLKSYGCANTERIHYTYDPPAGRGGTGASGGAGASGRGGGGGRGNAAALRCLGTRGRRRARQRRCRSDHSRTRRFSPPRSAHAGFGE